MDFTTLSLQRLYVYRVMNYAILYNIEIKIGFDENLQDLQNLNIKPCFSQ